MRGQLRVEQVRDVQVHQRRAAPALQRELQLKAAQTEFLAAEADPQIAGVGQVLGKLGELAELLADEQEQAHSAPPAGVRAGAGGRQGERHFFSRRAASSAK